MKTEHMSVIVRIYFRGEAFAMAKTKKKLIAACGS
jgi:hypothetical protein